MESAPYTIVYFADGTRRKIPAASKATQEFTAGTLHLVCRDAEHRVIEMIRTDQLIGYRVRGGEPISRASVKAM